MSIANGVKNQGLRKKLILNHREQKYFEALDMLIAGTTSLDYVLMRADKLKAIRRG